MGALLGVELPARGMVRCPFKDHDDVKPSFEVRSPGSRWICYGCDRRGGAIDLVMAIQDMSFIEAKRWLAEKTGMSMNGRRSRVPVRAVRFASTRVLVPPAEEVAFETAPDHELYAALLARAPLQASGKNYLHERRLTDPIIARFRIGQMPGAEAIEELICLYGFARVQGAGLLTQKSTPQRPRSTFSRGALLFPYFEAGSIVFFQARLMCDPATKSQWCNLSRRRRRIYNADVLARRDIQRIAICEGVIDVLSAAELKMEAVGLIGVSAGFSREQFVRLRGKQVDLLLDWDQAGEKRARTMLREMQRFGITATRKSRPSISAKDINDYLREVRGLL